MNKVLKALDTFLEENRLTSENFTEDKALLDNVPKVLKYTSILTVKRDDRALLLFVCDKDSFWIDYIDNKSDTGTIMLRGRLEKFLKSAGITQVR